MASNSLDEFFIKIGAIVDKKGFSEANRSIDGTAQKIASFVKFAGATLAAGAFSSAIQSVADRFNELGDIADRVGNVTAKELDKLGYVAELTGSDASTAQASFESLSRTIGEAASGIGRGAKVFEDFGIKVRNTDGSVKNFSQVLDDVRGRIGNLSRAEQTAYLQRMGLDKSLVGMMTSDTSAIVREYEARTKALGVNADEAARIGAGMNDAIKGMRRSFSDVVTAFAVRVMPQITIAIQGVTRWINENANLIRSFIEPLAKGFKVAGALITGFMVSVGKIAKALGRLPLVVGGVAVAWKAFNTIVSMSPLGRVIALISAVSAAIGLLIDDFEGFKAGKNSFFDWSEFIVMMDKVEKAMAGVVEFAKSNFKVIGDQVAVVVNFIRGLFTGDWSGFTAALENLKTDAAAHLELVKGIFSDAWEAVKSGFSSALDSMLTAFTDWFNGIMAKIKNLGAEMKDAVKNKVTGAWDSITGFFTGGKNEVAPDKNIAPASVANNQKTTNSTTTINQTFNGLDKQGAQDVATATIGREAYATAGDY